jgi:hypothetical protein
LEQGKGDIREKEQGRASPVLLSGSLLLLCVGFLLFPAAASALKTHIFLETFGSAEQPSFSEPEGLAVDQSSGDLLVIEKGTGAVSRWKPNGEPDEFSALGSNKIEGEGLSFGAPKEVQIAVDNSGGATEGDIYVPQEGTKVVDIFSSTGEQLGQLTESSEGAFAFPCGVAVDPSGNVYVGDFSSHIHKFANPPVNGESTDFEFGEACTIAAGAGATAGFIFPVEYGGSGKVSKLDSASGEEKYEVTGPTITDTVDPASGDVYTAVLNGSEVREFDTSGATEATLLSSFSPPSEVTGIAVDETTGSVYVARRGSSTIEVWGPAIAPPEVITEAANPVGTTAAALRGSVNPDGVALSECFFDWGETESYGKTAPCEEPDAGEVGEGGELVPVHAEVSGLSSGTTYHFRLHVKSQNSIVANGDDEEFLTHGPAILEEEASQVSATTARLSGLINANGEETSYFFEYVSESEEPTRVPASPERLESEAEEFVEVSRLITGLTPDTTYHFRIVASNPGGTNEGSERFFSTLTQAPPTLPDGRTYEMVTPPEKIGEPFPPEPVENLGGSCPFIQLLKCLPGKSEFETVPMQSAPDGEELAYAGQAFSGGLASAANEYISSRTASGWETKGLSGPSFSSETVQGFKAFSTDLTRGVLYQIEPSLVPAAPTREGKTFANLYHWQGGTLKPLVTVEPPHRDPGSQSSNQFGIFYNGANAGTETSLPFNHIVFTANDALTGAVPAVAPAAPEVEATPCEVGNNCNLYEWDEGQLRLVNVLPDNASVASNAVIGSRLSNKEPPDVDHAVSNDGSRIFWSDGSGQVFVRINGEETKEIKDLGGGRYLTASPDGSKVLLDDGCLYSVEEEECKTDLTEDKGGIHRGGFQGILGASEDLSRVYFIDTKILTGEEENANHERAIEEEGKFNLYVWHEGTTTFIGTLREADNRVKIAFPEFGDWQPSSSDRTAQVSSDGRFLTFMSQVPLTGYDNALSGSGECARGTERCYEVFEYDSSSAKLICASCNPSGQRPLGGSNLSLFMKNPRLSPIAPLPPPQNLTEDQGRLFFESMDTLTPGDTNGRVQDLYEWEPDGVGGEKGCHRPGGCVFLISSGNSPADSVLLNTTPSGDDVFFLTRERLLPRDKDEKLDVYDARVGGGFPEGEISACAGETCKGPITTQPTQPSVGSGEFSGSGNAKPKPPKHKKHHHKKKKHHRRGGSR